MEKVQGPTFVGLGRFRTGRSANESDVPLAQMPYLQRQGPVDAHEPAFTQPKALAVNQNGQATSAKPRAFGRDRFHGFKQRWIVGRSPRAVLRGATRALCETASGTFT